MEKRRKEEWCWVEAVIVGAVESVDQKSSWLVTRIGAVVKVEEKEIEEVVVVTVGKEEEEETESKIMEGAAFEIVVIVIGTGKRNRSFNYQNSMITNIIPIVSADDFDVKVGSILFWLLNIEPILVVNSILLQLIAIK